MSLFNYGIKRLSKVQDEPPCSTNENPTPITVNQEPSEEDGLTQPGGSASPATSGPSQGGTRKRSFPVEWKVTFGDWLEYDEVSNLMSCKLCKNTCRGKQGVWGSTGTDNFRRKTVTTHLKSEDHQLAVAAAEKSQPAVSGAAKKAHVKKRAAVTVAMKSAMWLAKEEVANVKFKSMIDFLRSLDVEEANNLFLAGNAQYTSPQIHADIIHGIDEVLKERLQAELQQSPFIAIGLDESSDRSQENHLVAVVRYISSAGLLKTVFLALLTIPDGTAMTIFHSLLHILRCYNIPIAKVIGLGTDGASAMASTMNGVTGRVMEVNPFTVCVHCVCHRLNLAVSQACKGDRNMATLQCIISSVYSHVQRSPKALQKFRDIAAILEHDICRFQRLYDIRWLSFGEALCAIIKNYEPLMVLLEDDAADGDPTAIGLLQQLKNHRYVSLLHLSADVFAATNHLSKIMQHNDVNFTVLGKVLADTVSDISNMKSSAGTFLTEFQHMCTEEGSFRGYQLTNIPSRTQDQNTLEESRDKFLTNVVKNLESRFPKVELLESLMIFDPAAYPSELTDLSWGRKELDCLLKHFGEEKQNKGGDHFPPVVDSMRVKMEFLAFKRFVHLHKNRQLRPTELLPLVKGNEHIFPECFKLMTAGLCVLVGNAEAERVFSCQNRVKTKLRQSLKLEVLERLIRISQAKPSIDDFNYSAALDKFFSKARRIK